MYNVFIYEKNNRFTQNILHHYYIFLQTYNPSNFLKGDAGIHPLGDVSGVPLQGTPVYTPWGMLAESPYRGLRYTPLGGC